MSDLFPRYFVKAWTRPICDGGGTNYGVIDRVTGTFASLEPACYLSGFSTEEPADTKAAELNGAVALAMRDWLSDCEWADMEPEDFDTLDPETLARGVNGAYDGGLRAFYADMDTVVTS